MSKRIIHVVTNVGKYSNGNPTGLWLSELAHAWDIFDKSGFEQVIVSPRGGNCPIEPRSLKFPNNDRIARGWHRNTEKMSLLKYTLKPSNINAADFDAIYFTGGHAVMYDLLDCQPIHNISKEIFENGGIISSVCHGYCGLLNLKLSDGSYLIANKKMTGFSWHEEIVAGVSGEVPYNAELMAKDRGAIYKKSLIPFLPYAVSNGRLITGQNPASAKATARRVVKFLDDIK